MKKTDKVVYKRYEMNQPQLIPPSVDELIPEKHMVRVVNRVVDQMDLSMVEKEYKGGGTSSYHPRMLLKILVYAYAEQIYSGRRIAKAVRENIPFMWIAGGNRPDFRTINRFRSERLRGKIQEVFTEVLEYLIEAKYVKFEHYFVDGTKIEADANRYSFVWKKSTASNRKKLEEKVAELFKKIDAINEAEEEEYGDKDLDELGEDSEIDSEKLQELADRLSQKLGEDPKNKEIKKAKKKIETDYLPRMKKYEQYEKALGGRNSCSKTDHDATFMQMKEDHMRNRTMKPGYNVQIGTEDQMIVGFSIHQTSTDSPTMISHLQQLKQNLGKVPAIWVADAGYGSEENYLALEEEGITPYVKYNSFEKDSKKRRKVKEKEKYSLKYFKYDEGSDTFLCPENKRLVFERLGWEKSATGFVSEKRVYHCLDCNGCPARELCTQSMNGRTIRFSPTLDRLRKAAFDRLTSEVGKKLRALRYMDVEAVFGLIKGNKKFRRFHLRGLEKVEVEWGLVSIAHNMNKIAAI
jgi:transposase